ncbi:TPA: HAD-IB family hydrolase, partial [Pseudomonas aeruginosa]
DTHGDHELLDAAQDAHWRHFHPAWRRSRSRYSKAGSPESVSPRESHSNSEDQQGA